MTENDFAANLEIWFSNHLHHCQYVYLSHIHTRHSHYDMPLSEGKDNKLWDDVQLGNNDSILQWGWKKPLGVFTIRD